MPLSDEEQKILKEIEAQLNATDPGLVEQVSRTTLYRHAARMIRWSALGVLAGLEVLARRGVGTQLGAAADGHEPAIAFTVSPGRSQEAGTNEGAARW